MVENHSLLMRSVRRSKLLVGVGLLSLLALACGSGTTPPEGAELTASKPASEEPAGSDPAGSADSSGLSPVVPETADTEGSDDGQAAGDLSSRIVQLDPADGIPEPPPPSVHPVTIRIDAIGLSGARVDDVGVEPSGEMEVPPPLEVGWYRYGPAPGEGGSAVLAGHIASGGIDGAFRHLDRLEPGDRVTIGFEDGSDSDYEVIEMARYNKAELPKERIFTDQGETMITLITCGGAFDYEARSYEDNVVAYAVPVGS